ncbi:hypothetical protein [Streptomyces sp. NPDC047973]|uniref:hypothetical protein n=1 Tax=Streptomyces sp. NPDC047973 TaxID=3155383 RepID=UPI0034264727
MTAPLVRQVRIAALEPTVTGARDDTGHRTEVMGPRSFGKAARSDPPRTPDAPVGPRTSRGPTG